MASGGPGLPTVDAHSLPVWEAAADGRLLIARCQGCGQAHHYPRPFCPFCWSDEIVLERASGRATLYTFSVVHVNDLPPFRDRLPYIAAVVDLEEGPRLMTNLVEVAAEELSIGMPIEAIFRPLIEGIAAIDFAPLGRAARKISDA